MNHVMRYSHQLSNFVGYGESYRFIQFMSGPKNESDILTGSSTPNRCGNPFERI